MPAVIMINCRVLKVYFDAQVRLVMLFTLYGICEGGRLEMKCDGTR